MGISLPQITATNLTLHHRNRSLDSALQKIPEVDISSSPDCERSLRADSSLPTNKNQEDLTSLGSDDSGILCGSDSGSCESANEINR